MADASHFYTAEKLMIALRDGRKLIGVLRSWDQFGMQRRLYLQERILSIRLESSDGHSTGNLVLQDTIERLFAQNLYADVDRGLFLVRGENVLLLGEIVRPRLPGHGRLFCSFPPHADACLP